MSEAYKKLVKTLRTLFEMDKADLDFGIYRILNQKRDEISRFLDEDLLPQVKAAFADYAGGGKAELQAELEQAIEQAKHFGAPDPEQAPPVLAIKAKLASAVDITAVENEVYSHLHTFFSRYYDQGDFISQRRYKADTYAIPYEGEEVKLYWANHDQYYVKSSEHLRDYAFTVHDDDGRTVRIKLVEADTEKDNVKAAPDQERRFVLDAAQPLYLEGDELQIRFQYVPAGRKKQDALNAEAVAAIFAQKGFDDWLNLLRKPAPTEANPKRTLLEKHLNDYTARNTFDYFIHKDLGAFLRRELDFYIKNEVLHLDDVDDNAFAVTEAHLRKIRVLRDVGRKIIRMLAQIEEFQKKLWLKKKFVIEANCCLTVDRVPESLYREIIANQEQQREWLELGFTATDTEITTDYLRQHPGLMIDTKYFSAEFKEALDRSFEDIDQRFDGLVIASDNFHGLELLKNRYARTVRCIYIDPPYNTGGDEFLYKDGFQSSSWISMIHDRIRISAAFLSDNGALCCSLDDKHTPDLQHVMERDLGLPKNGSFVWRTRNTDNRVLTKLSTDHEYIHVFQKPGQSIVGRRIDRSSYKNPDNDPRGPYTTDPLTGKANATDRPNLHYEIVNPKTGDVYPPDPDFGWITDLAGFQALLADNRIHWPNNPKTGKPRKKRFASEASLRAPVSTMEIKIKQGEGNIGLSSLMGGKMLNFPKPVSVIKTIVDVTSGSDDYVLDYFSGSGTTAHSVIELNRDDDGHRKYILVEMGAYFETLLLPRIKKIVYARSWENGKPQPDENGNLDEVSHGFRYLKLESYEDALNNLIISNRTGRQQDMLDDNAALREDYMLGYLLDVETADSPSMLNVDQFEDPFDYKLNIATGSVGAFKQTVVDLVETFNYLIGLRVKHIDTIRGFKVVTGSNPQDESVLVIWRKVKEQDNAALEAFMDKQGYNPRDTEFDRIYVNGDHTLEDPHSKVKMTEIEFKRLMFDVQDV